MKNKIKNQIVRMMLQFIITLSLQIFSAGCGDNATAQLKAGSKTSTLVALGFDQSLSVATFALVDTGFGDVFWNNQALYRWNDYIVLTLGYNKFWGALSHPLGSNRLVDYLYAKIQVGL